jgi:hypothetical protein
VPVSASVSDAPSNGVGEKGERETTRLLAQFNAKTQRRKATHPTTLTEPPPTLSLGDRGQGQGQQQYAATGNSGSHQSQDSESAAVR